MSSPCGPEHDSESLRAKIIGLGERSLRKSYYPELQKQLATIRQMNEQLEERIAERTVELMATNAALQEQIVERQQAEASLRRALEQLRALACDMAEAEERARRRLAQMLHDNVQQLLVAAKLRLSQQVRRLPEEAARRSLQETSGLLDQALQESRALTAELSPPILYDAGLAAGLEWLARQMEERQGVRVELTVEPAAAAAAGELGIVLFQATRELLSNVAQHAQADAAEVALCWSPPERLQLEVADHGVGFDPAILSQQDGVGRFGIFGIRERLSYFGGSLQIDSRPGAGTRVLIEVPLPAPSGPADSAAL